MIIMKSIRYFLKNQRLMFQIVLISGLFFIGATIGNIVLIYYNNMNLFLEDKAQDAQKLASYAANSMQDIEGIPWLISYWKEHYNEMNIIYDSEEDTKLRGRAFQEKYPQYQLSDVTMEQVENMTQDAQKLYAEYQYMKLTDDFDEMKRTYNPTYIYCFYPQSDTELFQFTTGVNKKTKNNRSDGSTYRLGTISEYNAADYPVLQATLKQGKAQNKLEQPIKEGPLSGYYHMFVPVVSDGQTLCVVCVTMETNSIKSELRRKLMVLELAEAAVFLLVGFVIISMMKRLLIRPIARLERSMQTYESNNDADEARRHLNDNISKSEIGQLTKEFINLTDSIEKHVNEIEQITSEQERMKAELSLAAGIQADMLPKEYPYQKEIELYGSMEPAKEVGGDFYDYFYVDENHLAIVVGDVSGKGVPASLFMVRSIMAIRSYTMMGLGVDEVFFRVNNELRRGNESELFTTSWLGVYEISTGKLSFAEAGHDAPMCIRRNGEIEWIAPKEKSLVLGSFEDMPYVITETKLEKGETIILYTDGFPEANNKQGEQYGMVRMEKSVHKHKDVLNNDLTYFMNMIHRDLVDYVGDAEQFDDLTMLALTVK